MFMVGLLRECRRSEHSFAVEDQAACTGPQSLERRATRRSHSGPNYLDNAPNHRWGTLRHSTSFFFGSAVRDFRVQTRQGAEPRWPNAGIPISRRGRRRVAGRNPPHWLKSRFHSGNLCLPAASTV